ncbi:VOC family protein [Paenibacillus sp. JCM 10914]|uniref:VOC family protein n=1 Tax=Paenibacillus sp. JCM 10914 TaxID=1236974 RepID=UPI000B11E4DD|nr:VOC family protein [Paenibacillus sp. JCM 10914]
MDLKTPSIDKTKAFYGELFSWRFKEEFLPGRVMTKMRSGEQEWGSLTSLDSPIIPKGAKPHTSLYVHVEHLDASVERVRLLGGTVLVEPFDVMNLRLSTIQDPMGAVITLQSTKEAHNVRSDMTTEGLPGWLELTTTDVAVSGEFYSKLFDWKLEYRKQDSTIVFQNRGQDESGMSVVAPDHGTARSEWNVYYTAQDCGRSLIKARTLGAHSITEIQDKPGVGQFASFMGPDGMKSFIMSRE